MSNKSCLPFQPKNRDEFQYYIKSLSQTDRESGLQPVMVDDADFKVLKKHKLSHRC
jgi:hypothetical protein